MVQKIKNLTADILSAWRKNSTSLSPKYVLDAGTKPIVIEDYEATVTDSVNGDWHRVKFTLAGEKEAFQFPSYRNKPADVDMPVSIRRFVAKEEFTASNGKVIPAGTEKWMAMQS